MRWRNFIVGFAILLLILGAIFMNQDDKEEIAASKDGQSSELIQPNREVKAQKGFAAPDFELETLTGERLRLYENSGKPTLINFWASWCPPCKKEMPDLQEAYEKYGNEVNFLMVDLTFNDNFDNMVRYIEENEYTFPIPLDKKGDVTKAYQAVVIPTTFIVDEQGIITRKLQGAMPEEYIQTMMKEITK